MSVAGDTLSIVFTYLALIGEIEETTALRRILTPESDILAATEDRERGARASLAMMPEHVEAQAAWRKMGEWFRARPSRRKPNGRKPRHVAPDLPPNKSADELGLYFVNLPDIA